MAKYELTPEEAQDLVMFGTDAVPGILEKLAIGQEVNIYSTHISNGNARLEEYLASLRGQGIDVGRGETKYGFKMPIPGQKDKGRDLIIFRRK